VAAGDAGDCISGGVVAPELADKCHQQLGGAINQSGVEFSLRSFRRGNVIGLGAGPLSAGGNPSDIVSSKNIGRYTSEPSSPALCRGRSVSVAPVRNVALPNSTKPASCDEARQGKPPGANGLPGGCDISEIAGHSRSIFGSRVSRRASRTYQKPGLATIAWRWPSHARMSRLSGRKPDQGNVFCPTRPDLACLPTLNLTIVATQRDRRTNAAIPGACDQPPEPLGPR
jgi:hypothetical protein